MPGGTTLIGTVVAALGLVLSVWAAAHALLYKRKPQSAFAWIAIAFAVPFLGVLLYYTFGINRVRDAREAAAARSTGAAVRDEPFGQRAARASSRSHSSASR